MKVERNFGVEKKIRDEAREKDIHTCTHTHIHTYTHTHIEIHTEGRS